MKGLIVWILGASVVFVVASATAAALTTEAFNPRGHCRVATDIDETALVFTQRPRPEAPGNVRLYDLVGRTASNPPAGVNTKRYSEAGGKLLGNTLLFARYSRSANKIFLFDLVNHERKLLDSISRPDYAQTGDVDGGLATWIRCRRFAHCQTFVYDLAAERKTPGSNPQHRSQCAVSLADDGTVYLGKARTSIAAIRSRSGGTTLAVPERSCSGSGATATSP
jgi:hypothetical protein